MENLLYTEILKNIISYISSRPNQKQIQLGKGITAFNASEIIAIGFDKTKEQVVHDIVNLQKEYKTKIGYVNRYKLQMFTTDQILNFQKFHTESDEDVKNYTELLDALEVILSKRKK